MEKLIELINEYEQLNMCRKFDSFEMHTFEDSNGVDRLLEDTVISRRYGFIKRLVDSDKIDERKLDEYRGNDYDHFNRIETLIQILSIQDNPIELLISYLK